ncbi:uncharacterized protein LOC143281711 [Babylonia areolata]|uniref:uncharacterized protein LOC143281711 n=1 Tax=Babylonia areolata TaxID=304850 RepID=UPI003FD514A8
MSQSTVQQEFDLGMENEGPVENVQDVTMESESEDEGIQTTKKRSKRMIIDDDDDDDDDGAGDAVNENADEDISAEKDNDQEEASNSSLEDNVETTPASKKKRPVVKKLTADEVLEKVLQDSDKEDETVKSDADEGPGDENDGEVSENGEASQGPMKFDGDLFDAEDSSDEDNDLDRAAGPEYDSAEDKDFEESAIDPKLLKKLKKLKGAAKKPREQKSRKCKPTKDDMLALRSESQRLIRETHVSLPYHKPAPKSLKDFLARAQKKQEVYKNLKRGTIGDIERAKIIQEKIAVSSIEKLPSVSSHRRRSSQRNEKQSSVTHSQQSLPDSGIVSSGVETQSQGAHSHKASGKETHPSQVSDTVACPLGEDELPDLVSNHSDGLFDSQNTLKGSDLDASSQTVQGCGGVAERTDSQNVSDVGETVVEQFDSPPVAEMSQSQQIEDVESLSVKEGDSQESERVTDSVQESLESDVVSDEKTVEGEQVTGASMEKNEHAVKTNRKGKQSCEDDSGIENDFSKQLNASSPVKATSQKKTSDKDMVSEESQQNSLKSARQKIVEELAQKGVVPAIGKGGGDFIILDEEASDKQEKKKKSNVDRLLERLMRHYPKKEPKKSRNVEISIVEKTGEEGQTKGLKLKTVTYRTEGEADLDLSSIAHTSGNRLQALKAKLEVGMRKQREAAYERRQQLYRMENEEGFEERAEDGLPAEEEEAEMTDGSDTEDEEEAGFEEWEEKKVDWNNPFLDDEAEDDDDDDEYDDGPQQRPVCAEINDMKEDDEDLFQDSDRLQLRLDQSDEEEDNDENQENEEEEAADGNDSLGSVRRTQSRSVRLTISDDEVEDDSSQLHCAQDPTKTCDPKLAANTMRIDPNSSFETLTPMSRLLQDTQPSSSASTQRTEDSQDLCGSPSNPSQTSFSDDAMSQILDADGYFRVPSSQPKRSSVRSSLALEGSQDAGDDNMDMLMGLCSGQFAEGNDGPVPSSGGFGGLFDNSSQSQDDRGSLTSLFDSSSQSQSAVNRDSQSEGDSVSQSEVIARRFGRSDVENKEGSGDPSLKAADGKSPGFSQPQKESVGEGNMSEVLGLCSGAFQFSSSQRQTQKQAEERKRGVKRRLIVHDDSSDEEGGTGPFLMLSDDEGTKGSDKNELSGSDEEDHNSDEEQQASFKGFKDKGKILQQFVEDEAELSGSEEAESDENLDLDEEDDYLEVEAGDTEVLNEDQLRDQVGRVHMKQILDDDDRQLMRYKEMYLPDGDLYSEGGGRQRRFHWKNLGDEESQNDLFANKSDEEKEEAEDPDEKQWRMERHEREKFIESQQEDNGENGEEENSQFLKFGQFFMKRQVSDPPPVTQQPTLSRPKLARSQSAIDKSSPGKFLKPKIPKRGSFLARSKENLARIAEITKASGLNVNGTRGSRSFVFSVNSSDKEEEEGKEQLLSKAAAKPTPAKKVTPHKPPAKKKCVEPAPKRQTQNSIFRLLDK